MATIGCHSCAAVYCNPQHFKPLSPSHSVPKWKKQSQRNGMCGAFAKSKKNGRLRINLRMNSSGKRKRELWKVCAKSDDSAEMSLESAQRLLGVREGATFDEVLEAKKSLINENSDDQERVLQLEAAYDALLMQRLMKRRAGEVADNSILYADVKGANSSSASSNIKRRGLNWIKGALRNAAVDVEKPSGNVVSTQTAVYGVLMAWTYATGFSSFSGQASDNNTSGITLAIGFGASLYFLRNQKLKLGKAVAITTAGMVAGAVIGNVVEWWLHVEIVPILGINSSTVFVTEFALASLWLFSLYLR